MSKGMRELALLSLGVLALLLVGGPLVEADFYDLDASFPLFATWVRNEAKSSFNRGNQVRQTNAPRGNRKWVMNLENGGVRQRHYDTAESTEPLVSIFYKFDGMEWKDPHGGKPPGEVVLPWLINPDTQIRYVHTPDRTTEWSLYVVSADGKSFTVTAWDEVRPWARNIQVFDKVQ